MGKKVLYAASSFGHLRSFHIPYISTLRDRGYEVCLVGSGSTDGLISDYYVNLSFEKTMWSPKNFGAAIRLSKKLRIEHYDIICVHTSLAAFFVRLAVMLAGNPKAKVINTVHGYLFDEATSFPKRAVMLLAEKLTAPVTDAVVVMNRQDSEIARSNRLSKGDVVFIDGMGVDFTRFVPASSDERCEGRRALGIPEDAFVMVYAAEFSTRKNQAMLIRAMEKLPENVYLILPGRGACIEECRQLAKPFGSRVMFPGFVSDVEKYYRAADICVSASRIEGLPFNVMEAMHCALPAVLSDVKGHQDLVSDGENGFLYPFGDENAFVKAVTTLQNDPAMLKALGEAASKSVKKYSLETVFEKTLNAIIGE